MRRAGAAMLAVAGMATGAAQAQMYTYAAPTSAPAAMSDDDLAYTVAKALTDDDSLRGAVITLKVVDHHVVLEGITLSDQQAKQARAVAEFVVGAERVLTEIEVAR